MSKALLARKELIRGTEELPQTKEKQNRRKARHRAEWHGIKTLEGKPA
jgi:hypothetical protein